MQGAGAERELKASRLRIQPGRAANRSPYKELDQERTNYRLLAVLANDYIGGGEGDVSIN